MRKRLLLPRDVPDEYEIVGSGTYGTVIGFFTHNDNDVDSGEDVAVEPTSEAENTRATTNVALKVCFDATAKTRTFMNDGRMYRYSTIMRREYLRRLARETAVMDFLQGFPHIIQCDRWYLAHHLPETPSVDIPQETLDVDPDPEMVLYFVQPFIGPSLKSHLWEDKPGGSKQRRILPEATAKKLIVQLLIAVGSMHECGLFHRDLAPGNVLLSKDDKEKLTLCDFGLSRAVNRQREGETLEVITPLYRPPEIDLKCTDYGGVSSKTACDVWSIGCLFAEMMSVECLFPGRGLPKSSKVIQVANPSKHDLDSLLEISNNSQFSEHYFESFQRYGTQPLDPTMWLVDHQGQPVPVSFGCIDVLKKMFVFHPAKRATIPELLRHDYFAQDPVCKVIVADAIKALSQKTSTNRSPEMPQQHHLPFPPLPQFNVPELESLNDLQSLLRFLQQRSRATELMDTTLTFPPTG